MNFEKALELIKAGHKLQRKGWNGRCLYVRLVKQSTVVVDNEVVTIKPFFAIVNHEKTTHTWVPSVSDIMADDWLCVGLVEQGVQSDEQE